MTRTFYSNKIINAGFSTTESPLNISNLPLELRLRGRLNIADIEGCTFTVDDIVNLLKEKYPEDFI